VRSIPRRTRFGRTQSARTRDQSGRDESDRRTRDRSGREESGGSTRSEGQSRRDVGAGRGQQRDDDAARADLNEYDLEVSNFTSSAESLRLLKEEKLEGDYAGFERDPIQAVMRYHLQSGLLQQQEDGIDSLGISGSGTEEDPYALPPEMERQQLEAVQRYLDRVGQEADYAACAGCGQQKRITTDSGEAILELKRVSQVRVVVFTCMPTAVV
jgi:hypothetical protein